ncbi:MAG: hypothetical protein MJE12_03315 [Alphaproteobacteria bacterium]|nr:hypothetical protein [Alphaproteobacteria bacterium]
MADEPGALFGGEGLAFSSRPRTVFNVGPPTSKPVDERAMLKGLDYDLNGESETRLIVTKPVASLRVKNFAEESIAATVKRFPNISMRNTQADAYRHALWSYKMTRAMGPVLAKRYGDAHEISVAGPARERLMDLYNNNVGRRLAMDPKNWNRDPEQVILDALRRGELQTKPFVIRPGTAVPTPLPGQRSSP